MHPKGTRPRIIAGKARSYLREKYDFKQGRVDSVEYDHIHNIAEHDIDALRSRQFLCFSELGHIEVVTAGRQARRRIFSTGRKSCKKGNFTLDRRVRFDGVDIEKTVVNARLV